jgi:hypothetical protein
VHCSWKVLRSCKEPLRKVLRSWRLVVVLRCKSWTVCGLVAPGSANRRGFTCYSWSGLADTSSDDEST